MRPSILVIAALAATLTASAGASDTVKDYAWQWPIQTDGEASAYVLELDADVLQYVTRNDLRDLAVFNADGEAVAFAPWPRESVDEPKRDAMPWLRVPLPANGQAENLALRLERDAEGRLRGLDLRTQDGAPMPDQGHELLIDRGEAPPPVSVLHVALAEDAQLPVNLRVRISASDDLIDWQRLGRGLPLLALEDNGLRVERLQLAFPATQARYLRLAIEGEGQWPALSELQVERPLENDDQAGWLELELAGTPATGEDGVLDFRTPGPVAVARVDVKLRDANTVAAAQIGAKTIDDDWWRPVASFTAFRLGAGAQEVRHLPPDIVSRRDREWRLTTQPALKDPTLVLSYRPERFVLLAQGPAPYTLAAGSVNAERGDYPVKAALEASTTPPAPATLGQRKEAGGEAALAPRRGEDWQRWLLWAVLAIGAALVLVVSLKVLRHPKAD